MLRPGTRWCCAALWSTAALVAFAAGACPPQPVPRDVEVEVTTCSGREFRDTCHAECKDGFLGEGAIWICEKDDAWENPVRHSCQPVNCGEPDFERDRLVALSVVAPCSSNSFGGGCAVTCQPGHRTTGAVPLNDFELYCNADGEWQTTDNVTCVDIDGCADGPCDLATSDCEDQPAPLDGWTCRCKDGLYSSGDPNGDGKECKPALVDMRAGVFDFQTGAGLDVHFDQGTIARSARHLDAAISRQGARVADPVELAESLAEIKAVTETGVVGDNRRRVDGLVAPNGTLTEQGERVAQLQAEAKQIADRMQQETTRASGVEARQTTTLEQLRTELLRIQREHADLTNDHAATKSFAASLVTQVNELSASSRVVEETTKNITLASQGPAQALQQEMGKLEGCASDTSVADLVAAMRAEFEAALVAMVTPIVKADCLDSGNAFDDATGKCVLGPIGLSEQRPATSCRALLAEAHGRADGVYWILLANTREPQRVYCDQSRNGGGWELVMKMVADTTFQYSSPLWTEEVTLNPGSLDDRLTTAKLHAYNYGVYEEVVAYISDGSTSFEWRLNVGNRVLPAFFSVPQVLSTTPRAGAPFTASKGRFSFQTGFQRYVIATCASTSTDRCVRWGFLWNNENDDRSIDVLGGFGMQFGTKSYGIGDGYNCCGSRGANRAFSARLYARVAAA